MRIDYNKIVQYQIKNLAQFKKKNYTWTSSAHSNIFRRAHLRSARSFEQSSWELDDQRLPYVEKYRTV